jgi:hypothetical protein
MWRIMLWTSVSCWVELKTGAQPFLWLPVSQLLMYVSCTTVWNVNICLFNLRFHPHSKIFHSIFSDIWHKFYQFWMNLSLVSQGFLQSRLRVAFRKFYGLNSDLVCHSTTLLQAKCCLMCFILIVKSFLTHWSWLWVVPFTWSGNRAHAGCDRSTGDEYFS